MLIANPFQAMRLVRTKKNLRNKAFKLSCMGQQDALATPRNIDIGNAAAPKKMRPAYHSTTTSTWTEPESALIPEVANEQHVPAIAVSASPTASLWKTPPSKIDARRSALRRKPSFRTLAYDPSAPLVHFGEATEVVANDSVQLRQNTGLLLSESQAEGTRGVSHRSCNSAQEAHHKADAAPNNLLNTPLTKTSSPISLSNLDSSAFDAALMHQASAKDDSHAPSNSNSLNTTLLIHSDAIFLPSAITAKTSSAVPSSEGKRTGTGSTSSQIAQILRAVDADRHQLEVQHARMVEALREAEREKIEYRDFIAGLMQRHVEHEGRLLGRIAELRDECDRKGCDVERLRRVVAGMGQVGEKVE